MRKIYISVIWAITTIISVSGTENLIVNPSFENGVGDWNFKAMKGKVINHEPAMQIETGEKALTMTIESADVGNLIDNKYGAWGRIHKILKLKTGVTYRVKASLYISENYKGSVSILIKAGPGTGTKHFFGNNKIVGAWQELGGTFTATSEEAMIFINTIGNEGNVTFDNIELVEVSAESDILKNGKFDKVLLPWIFDMPRGYVEGIILRDGDMNIFKMTIKTLPSFSENEIVLLASGRLRQKITSVEVGKKYKFTILVRSNKSFSGSIDVIAKFSDEINDRIVKTVIPPKSLWHEISFEFIPSKKEGVISVIVNGSTGEIYFADASIKNT